MNILDEIILAQKQGERKGLVSVCSAHLWVLRAVAAFRKNRPVLIEATCNQVHQFGGYTGMKPKDFVKYVSGILEEREPGERKGLSFGEHSFPDSVLLGGDHLGPSVWQSEPAEVAMQKAETLVKDYVQAGFGKLHLDASIKLGDDPAGNLALEDCVARVARLVKAAESARIGFPAPRYVIGTEVPVPGGAQEFEEGVVVTTVAGLQETLNATRAAFRKMRVDHVWDRVIAVVVQPGVEFGDDFVLDYQPERTRDLVRFIESKARLVYEAHSTDYQTRTALKNLVQDHFAFLKVGPALTFAFREAVFALAMIEKELFPLRLCSQIIKVLDSAMMRHPEHWRTYYHGTTDEQTFKRKYSLSDRSRYYWGQPEVRAAMDTLLRNLREKPIPFSLLSQFVPYQVEQIRVGDIPNTPEAMILSRIGNVLEDYWFACEEN